MEQTIAQIIAQIIDKSAPAALAIFAIWMLRQSYKERSDDAKAYAQRVEEQREQEREDKLALNNTLQDVAARMSEMCTVLQMLARSVGVKTDE